MNPRLLYAGCVCWFFTSSTVSALSNPRLTITNVPGGFVLSWAVSATNWVLEESETLPATAPWARVMTPPYETNGALRSARVAAGTNSHFYRLRSLTPVVPGLAGSWQLDEGAGSVAGDASGPAGSLLLSNVTWAAGRLGPGSLHFNGATGAGASRAWVSNENHRVPPAEGRPFSVSMWFCPDAVTIGSRGLAGNDTGGTNGWHVALHSPGPGTNLLVFAGAGSSLSVTGRTLLLPGQWHQLTVTHDGGEGSVYLDGELLGRGNGGIAASDGALRLGGGAGGYASFLGRIDAVRLHTNCLTPEEISLTGHWRFDEGCLDFVGDESLQGNHGRVTDGAAWASGREGAGIDLGRGQVMIGNDWNGLLPGTGGPFSLSFWVRPESLPSGRSGLMSCGVAGVNGWDLAVDVAEGGSARMHINATNWGGTLDFAPVVPLSTGVWTKVDVTFNGGIATLYANGRKLGEGSGAIRAGNSPLILGSVPASASFPGVIDDLRIYNRERGESEIGPVAPVMWETVLRNTSTNIALPGSGPAGRTLVYSLVPLIAPTNGTVTIQAGSSSFTYTAGGRKGPDAFTYTVSDGEFTTPPAIVTMSVVEPHWLSPGGGTVEPRDGSSPEQSWAAGSADALDAIWKTNNFYDCFFYAPGDYETRGWKYLERPTANTGCKHIGSGSEGPAKSTIRLVDVRGAWSEGNIFAAAQNGIRCDGFEVHRLLLDCNAENLPKYIRGEQVWIRIPLASTGVVDSVTLRWANKSLFLGRPAPIGRAVEFSICARRLATNTYVTNCISAVGTGQVSVVTLGVEADELLLQLDRPAPGVEYYGLSEIEISGGTTGVPTARIPGGGASRLSVQYPAAYAADGNPGTAWTSGAESQAQLELPLRPGTALSHVILHWHCKTVSGLGRFGAASGYLIRAWDDAAGQYQDVPFVRHPRAGGDWETNTFGAAESTNTILTSRLLILLTNRMAGVNFYSLREVALRNGAAPAGMAMPSAMDSLALGDYSALRAFDGDSATEWASGTRGMVGAISALGNNMKFTHLKIVGFGTKAPRECFPVGAFGNRPAMLTRYGNILLENCLITDPATNNTDGISAMVFVGNDRLRLTNTVIRRCTVANLKPYFTYSEAFGAVHVENSVATNCGRGMYFEPAPHDGGDYVGPVLVRSNLFTHVERAIDFSPHSLSQFDSIACIRNEIVLTTGVGWAFGACDTCYSGPTGTTTNATLLNNIIRFADWAPRPASPMIGLYYADIQHAVFANNIVALGTVGGLRIRWCPSGQIPGIIPPEDCDHPGTGVAPPPTYPPCLDVLRPGYRRAWLGNRDLSGALLPVRYGVNNVDGLSSLQQYPD